MDGGGRKIGSDGFCVDLGFSFRDVCVFELRVKAAATLAILYHIAPRGFAKKGKKRMDASK